MAIDAVVANLRAQLRKLAALAFFVALQALFRISGRRAFGRVHFMAHRAAHLRILVAAAPLRHRHLIAVNVHSGVGIGPLQANVVLQRLPRNVRKRRPKRLPDSSVALRADFHLPLPRQRRRIPNLGGHDLGGHDFSRAVIARAATRHSAAEGSSPRYHTPLPFHMLSPSPMAPLARNPQYVPVFSVDILRRC